MKGMSKKQVDILLAASREFEELGFAGTGMERIAESAKVSKRTLYKHYGSKEDVFSAIINYLRQSVRLEKCSVYDPGQPVEQQLRAVIETMLAHLNRDEHVRLARIVISEVVRQPELAEILSRTVDFSGTAPFRWVQAAMQDGQLRDGDPEKALVYLAGLVKSLALWPRLIFCAAPMTEDEIRDVAAECAAFFLGYYRAEATGEGSK